MRTLDFGGLANLPFDLARGGAVVGVFAVETSGGSRFSGTVAELLLLSEFVDGIAVRVRSACGLVAPIGCVVGIFGSGDIAGARDEQSTGSEDRGLRG